MKLIVFYEGPFWVGVAEEEQAGRLKAVRYVFGAEPQDAEVLELIQVRLLALFERVEAAVAVETLAERRINPKRRLREASRELATRGPSSKAQDAIQEQLLLRKKQRQQVSKQQREAQAAYKREVARQKAKAKHRGH